MRMQQNIFGGKGCDLNGVTQRVDGRGDCPDKSGLTTQEVTFEMLSGNYAGKRTEVYRRTVLGEPYEGHAKGRCASGAKTSRTVRRGDGGNQK
jgi:hypothetical protein